MLVVAGVANSAPPTHTISGFVLDGWGAGVGGVDVVGDNGAVAVVTGADGAYLVTVSNHWDGTITVSKTSWLITPASKTYNNVSGDIAGEDYAAYQPTISGTVKKADGTPLAGAIVAGNNGGGSDTTDTAGFYEFPIPYNWTGDVSVSLAGYHFTDKNHTSIIADQTNQDYSGFQPMISGSTGIAGATVTFSGVGSVVSSPSYSVTVPYGWSGTVEVTLAGYNFTPQTYSTPVIANQTNQNFTGFQPTISGSTGIAGATVTFSGIGSVISTPSYSVTVPYGWSGTVETTLAEYNFAESPRDHTNVTADITGQDFTPNQPTISGYVTDSNGGGVESVLVSADNGGGSDTTVPNGYYEISVPYNWSGVVSVNKMQWSFSPGDMPYTNVISDQTDQDYIASYVGIAVKQDGTGDFTTIQSAINAAVVGDTVIVHPGRYYEKINFGGKDIILRSTSPKDPNVVMATIIDANGPGTVVTFLGSETAVCRLEGFTITGSRSYGAGVYGYHTNATLSDCVISDNSTDWYGGGVFQVDGIIQNCTVSGNSGDGGGGLSRCDGIIRNCEIIGNSSDSWGGGLYKCNGTIQNCTINDNSTDQRGGGLSNCDGAIQNCTITGNSAVSYGGGLAWCNMIIQNCIIWGNTASSLLQKQMYNCVDPIYSCIQDWIGGGVGNISVDPLFVNAASSNYHLSFNSPCINTGNPAYDSNDQMDIDGDPRLVGTVDIGADEYFSSEPLIAFSGHEFNFTAYENQQNPVSQSLTIGNFCTTTDFNWTIAGVEPWLSANNSSGTLVPGQQSTIDIGIDITSLIAGTYNSQLTLTATNAINNTELININLTIVGPSLGISQGNFSFTASKQTVDPLHQTLTITNVTGGGTLNWTITPDCNWMIIEPNSGAIADGSMDVILDIDQNNADYGSHTCQLIVDAPDSNNSPQYIDVTLDVLRPYLAVSPSQLYFETAIDEPNDSNQILSIQNAGYDTFYCDINVRDGYSWYYLTQSSCQGETKETNEIKLTINQKKE